MDHKEVGRFWNANAAVWTRLARAGYDVYRDHLNTPAFFELLPEVTGLRGLDIGCGEGHNTRLLAKRGAKVTGIDIAETFIAHARKREEEEPLGIAYEVASAVELPFADASFDFATGFMSFMDIPETDRVLAEAYRTLEPGGSYSSPSPTPATIRRTAETCAMRVAGPMRSRSATTSRWSTEGSTNGSSPRLRPTPGRACPNSGSPALRGRSASGSTC